MLRNKHLKDWSKIVSYHFPHLSLPEVVGLATWSFGMVMMGSSSLTRVSEFIAKINGEKTNTVRQRLKEWYQDSKDKKGEKRRELDVSQCFAPLLKWILSLWQSEEKWLPLAIDATNIGQNFTVLSLHVLYQGCGIPIAWKIVKGREKGSWKPHWLHIFDYVKDVIPDPWQVIVLADRGLYADWLFEAICSLNWHPFLRINHQGHYQLRGDTEWRCLDRVAPKTRTDWSGYVTCFKNNSLECTLLARWHEGYKEPWLIVTDLEPTQAQSFWYGLRAWIESSYRDIKSDGWQWQKTRLREPARAERIWLAMAIATLWTVTVGSEGQQHPSKQFNDKPNPNYRINSKSELRQQPRKMSCFLQGLINIIADLVCGKGIYLKGLFPRQFFFLNTS